MGIRVEFCFIKSKGDIQTTQLNSVRE